MVRILAAMLAGALALAPALAATGETGDAGAASEAADAGATVGRVTSLPLPRYVSLKTSEGNVRRGPSLSHRIDWVFTHRDMPLRVTAEFGNWRRVEDQDGQGGWIHYSLLSGVRTVLIAADMTPLRSLPEDDAAIVAEAEAGVIARLGDCGPDWCRITADGTRGWVRKSALWGVDAGELRD